MAAKNRYPDIDVTRAIEQQRRLAGQVVETPLESKIRVIAGADATFSLDEKYCIAAIISFSWPDLEVIEKVVAKKTLNFPYIPGLLSFREAPAVVAAGRKMREKPDILLIDGQGRAHPRRFGLACHVGVELGWPTIGCAKSRLIGENRAVGRRKGCQCRLMDHGELIGKAVRSRDDVKCLYVSVGHRIELEESVRIVLRSCRRYRLPEPTRQAHLLVSQIRQKVGMDNRFDMW